MPDNAFTSVRPRGAEAPSAAPQRTNHSRAPLSGHLRDLAPAVLHDESACRKRFIESAAEVALKDSARQRGKRTACATPADRARSIARNEDKV